MITIEKFSYGYPQKDLYEEISFTIEEGQHAAFIGSSGSGKSTLIDMIMDPDKYMYDGKLEINTKRKIGYISQFTKFDRIVDLTVFEYIAEEYLKAEKEIESICKEMETTSQLDELLEKYQIILDSYNAIGGDSYESRINSQLNLAKMGDQKEQKVADLSGGEIKLIQVIKEMLTNPDLLIMDEPDVFLDFNNLNVLKKLINTHKGTLLIITHNRYLLDHCFDKIVHLEDKNVQEFDGRYIDYNFSLLERKIELQELALADIEEIARNEKLIDRLRETATFNAESANGRKLNARVKVQERLVARQVKEPFVDIQQPNIQLSTDKAIKDEIAIEVKDYQLSFDKLLLEHVDFKIKSTDKVALIGPNGTGKTTLFKDLINHTDETIEINDSIELAYLSQTQSDVLNIENTVLNEFLELGIETNSAVKKYIMEYGFDEEIVAQKIDSLSGGEKNILQLAKISLGNANMLLLDEPMSHLDTYAQMALEDAINSYEGAVLMVSHDFYSIINCMDYILIIDEKRIRRMSMRKFRRIIYAKYFDKDYLLIEQKKKEVETKVAIALEKNDFEQAKLVLEELEKIIALL